MKWTENWKKCKDTKSIESGQGTVSKVINILSAEFGALKELHLEKLSSERKERFKGEIKTIKRLNLDRIPKILEDSFDEEANEYYYISQWIEGRTLSNYISQKKDINIDLAVDICRKLCTILISCHSEGVYHRDIKPDNIIITDKEDIFLIDFGISHDEKDDFKTPIGQELGNRFLKLPEVAKGVGKKADPRTDVTLVVGILFFLLYQSSPNQLLDQNSLPPHQVKQQSNDKILADPKWPLVEVIFDRGFKNEIRERFPSVEDLLKNLNSVLTFDPKEQNLKIPQTVSAFKKLRESNLKDHHKTEEFLRENLNQLTKKIQSICEINGFSDIHQLAKSEKNGKKASQLWKLSEKNHNEPYLFLNVEMELVDLSEGLVQVVLKSNSAERTVKIDKVYYIGVLYNFVQFTKESDQIAEEIFDDAVNFLMEKIKISER